MTASSGSVLPTALETRYPKRQSTTAAALLPSAARIIADVSINGRQRLKKKQQQSTNQIFRFNKLTVRTHQRTLGLFRKGGDTPCLAGSTFLVFAREAVFPPSRCASPAPFTARSVFSSTGPGSERKNGPVPLSHMPQNSTNRRLLPHAAPPTSADLQRHLPAKWWKGCHSF